MNSPEAISTFDHQFLQMKICPAIATQILEAYEGNNWSEVCVKDVVADIQFEEAVAITEASPNSIAALLYHMMFYNNAVCQRLRGEEPHIGSDNGFDLPTLKGGNDWQQLISDAMESAKNLSMAIADFREVNLFKENPAGLGTFYKKMHGVIEHNYYHLGQIMILKKLIRGK